MGPWSPSTWLSETSAASRAVQMVSGASRALVATILPFYKFSWPPIGRAAMPHSQNLNGQIHAHSFLRILSFFGEAATPLPPGLSKWVLEPPGPWSPPSHRFINFRGR